MKLRRPIYFIIIFVLTFTLGCNYEKSRTDSKEEFINAIYKNLVYLEGGTFDMGEKPSTITHKDGTVETGYWSSDGQNVHKVMLDSFSIMKFEVTYGEYDFYTDYTGKELIQKRFIGSKYKTREPSRPAGVDWQQACDFCDWLAEVTGKPFALPTEAQWEYAARSGGREGVLFSTPSGKYEEKNAGSREIKPVGSYDPNPAGIYDMTQNVQEWVWDWYAEDYFMNSPLKNPKGPETGTEKIRKGGALSNTKVFNTVYTRDKREIYYYKKRDVEALRRPSTLTGFRCVLNEDQTSNK